MNDNAKKLRAAYQREYKRKNKAKINEYNRAWRKANPEKVKQYNINYWEKKTAQAAEDKNP